MIAALAACLALGRDEARGPGSARRSGRAGRPSVAGGALKRYAPPYFRAYNDSAVTARATEGAVKIDSAHAVERPVIWIARLTTATST